MAKLPGHRIRKDRKQTSLRPTVTAPLLDSTMLWEAPRGFFSDNRHRRFRVWDSERGVRKAAPPYLWVTAHSLQVRER